MRKITENLRKLYNLGYQILEKLPHMESLSAKNPKEGCVFGLNFLKQVAIEIQERNTPVKNCTITIKLERCAYHNCFYKIGELSRRRCILDSCANRLLIHFTKNIVKA